MKDKLLKMNIARIRSVLSILLCVMLVCGAVMSATVFAEETAAGTSADASDTEASAETDTEASAKATAETAAETTTETTAETASASTDTEAAEESASGTTDDSSDSGTAAAVVAGASSGTGTETSDGTGAETASGTGTNASTGTGTETSAEADTEASSETGITAASENAAEAAADETQETDRESAASETESGTEAAEASTETAEDTSTETTAEADTEAAAEETDRAAEMPAVELTGSVDNITVVVSAPEGAFAESVTMVVEEADEDAFDEAVQADLEENDPDTTYIILDSTVVEISFYDTEGNEVQPETEVEVTISGLSLLTEVSLEVLPPLTEMTDEDIPSAGEESEEESASELSSDGEENDIAVPDIPPGEKILPGETMLTAEEFAGLEAERSVLTADCALIYHMDDEGNVECIVDGTPGESSYTFTTDSFSEYGIVNASEENGIAVTADNGNNNNNQGNQGGGETGGDPGSGGSGGGQGGGETDTETESETDSGSGTTYTYYHIDLRVSSTVDITVTNSAETTTDVTVTKVWEDDDESDRPSSITVYLTDDSGNYITDSSGEYITATLTAANNWSYTWEGLSLGEGTYSVTEDDVSGYTMTDATTFEIVDASTATSVTYTGTITVDSITSLIVTHDGVDYEVEMSSEKTLDENDNVYEFASVAGHGSNGSAPTYTLDKIVNLEEGDTITVTVVYSYYYTDSDGNEYSGSNVTTTVTITVDEDDNICDGTAGTDQYGFDFKITALQLLEAESALTDDQELTITNTVNTTSITVTKEVTGNMGDTTKKFTFTLTDSNGEPVGTLDSTGSALTASGFTLSDGESETISGLTVGDTVYLAESDNENYTVTVTDSSGNEISPNSDGLYEITVGSGVSITVTNYYNIEPDIGVGTDSAPYTALLSGAVLAGIVALIDRRRRLF